MALQMARRLRHIPSIKALVFRTYSNGSANFHSEQSYKTMRSILA